MTLWHQYGVRSIAGIRFGYRGLLPQWGYETIDLDHATVSEIHRQGGTILGSSRGGGEKIEELVDSIERMNLSLFFTIGGDGTQRGACRVATCSGSMRSRTYIIPVSVYPLSWPP